MKTWHENAKDLPVWGHFDVLVCGGGPAGIGAALRAGRMGVRTMILDRNDCLGGIATAGMMSHWTGRSSSRLLKEIKARTKKVGEATFFADEGKSGEWTVGDHVMATEAMKIVLDEMMAEAGVEILYYTTVCDACLRDGKICGVVVENKSGRGVMEADYVIDATGDGDVAAFAGVPYCLGRESDHKMQPATIMFKIGGVDDSRAVFPGSFETLVPTAKGELQALGKQILPFPAGHVLLYQQPLTGTVCVNMTNAIDVDGTDAASVTRATIECRAQILPIIRFLRQYAPGYENCYLLGTASLLGVRETRHFYGKNALREDDILTARYHEDWVVRHAYFNFDVHNMSGAGLDATGIQHKWQQSGTYTIPYGCLLPEGVEGLLLSGRNIAGSHLAHSNFRVMPVCIAIGEAAGAAAALAKTHGQIPLGDVMAAEIQQIVGEDEA